LTIFTRWGFCDCRSDGIRILGFGVDDPAPSALWLRNDFQLGTRNQLERRGYDAL